MTTICLFTGVYFNNIGNAFIDIGAEETIKAAVSKDSKIIKLSQCPFFAASMGKGFALKENKIVHLLWVTIMQKYAKQLHDRAYSMISPKEVFNLVELCNYDYMVVPGCVLTVPFITIFGHTLKKIAAGGTKIIFLGASGNFYIKYEIEAVSKFLRELKPYALMTRDSKAFSCYSKFSQNVYNGIDNAFFVNKTGLGGDITSLSPYTVLNFDEPKHYHIRKELQKEFTGRNIILSNHKPHPYSNIREFAKKGIMISDMPLDYLFLYSNVNETYSDRVHACIPTLSFGHKCQLFSDSPRIALFENVGLPNITKELTSIEGLDIIQNSQIEFLKNIFKC